MSYASNVQMIRDTLKIDRAELARRAGVDVSTVSRWERGGVPERGSAWAFLNGLAKEAGYVGMRPSNKRSAA